MQERFRTAFIRINFYCGTLILIVAASQVRYYFYKNAQLHVFPVILNASSKSILFVGVAEIRVLGGLVVRSS